MHWKVLLVLLCSVIAYLLLGALAFHYIERPTEESLQTELQALTTKFLSQYSCLDAKNLTIFLAQVIDAYKAGYRMGDNGTIVAPAPKWDYPSSVFFSMTVITTIGYGNLSPSTSAGQAFCCVYALIGIPLLAIMLSGIAERVTSLRQRVQNCQCWRDKGRLPEIATGLLYFLIGFLLFFIIPAAVFSSIEGWSYSVGMYYSFITLSTIGFGDYVAGQTMTSAIYKFSLSLWIYIGLVFMSGVISTVQGFMEQGAKNAEAKVDAAQHQFNEAATAASASEEVKKCDTGNDGTQLEVLS